MRATAVLAGLVIVVGALTLTPATAAPPHRTKDLWAHMAYGGHPWPAVRGPSHYHRHGHRRRIEFTLRHAGRLNHKQVRIWVHGDYVGKTRAKDGRIHLQLDTAHRDFVPHVQQFNRTVVRLRHKTYHGDPNLHKLIATGEYICEHRHCRP
jgi:hypothetical protein